MFSITIPVEEIARELEVAADELDRAEMEILERVADELIKFIREDFDIKAAGGTGAGGIKWPADKSDPGKKIGVESGETRRRIVQSPSGEHAVNVLFASAWARFFDAKRTLIPDPMPPEWMKKLEDIALPMAEKIVREVLGNQQ